MAVESAARFAERQNQTFLLILGETHRLVHLNNCSEFSGWPWSISLWKSEKFAKYDTITMFLSTLN